MRIRILPIVALLLFFTPTLFFGQEATVNEDIQFEERVFNFGEIEEENGMVTHTFKFKNKGSKTLVITNVRSGCGCVQTTFTKKPILPMSTGEVSISFNPAYRPGFFSKEIVVLSNNGTTYNRIWIKGVVKPGIRPVKENYPYEYGNGLWLDREVLVYGTFRLGEDKTLELGYANASSNDIKLIFMIVGGNTDISFTSPHLVKAGEKGVMPITYRYTQKFTNETFIYPIVNGEILNKALKLKTIYSEK